MISKGKKKPAVAWNYFSQKTENKMGAIDSKGKTLNNISSDKLIFPIIIFLLEAYNH